VMIMVNFILPFHSLAFFALMFFCQDSGNFTAFLPPVDVGFGAVGDSDIFALFIWDAVSANYRINQNCPADARSVGSLFLFVPL
jgi:hypothetical protein